MRLLPRTPRGIWLLAAIVWGVGCAIDWWQLPTAPRKQVPFEMGDWGLSSDGRFILRTCPVPPPVESIAPHERKWAVEMRSVTSGGAVARFGDFGHNKSAVAPSPDGRFLALRDSDQFDEQRAEIMMRLVRLDLANRSTTRWSALRSIVEDRCLMDLSPGGRFCVLRDHNPRQSALIWDLDQDRITALEPTICNQITFSSDGRQLAAQSSSNPGRIHIIELESASIRRTLAGPDVPPWDGSGTPSATLFHIRISDDGSHVVAHFYTRGAGHETFGWNSDTGQLQLRTPSGFVGFTDGGSAIITESRKGTRWNLEVFDFLTNSVRASFPVEASHNCLLSLDGRLVIAPTQEPNDSILERWATRFGLPWPFDQMKERVRGRVYEVSTGEIRGEFATSSLTDYGRSNFYQTANKLISDGLIVTLEGQRALTWCFWDVPPRKPLGDFATRAAILVAVIALIAWRFQRHVRLKNAAVT